MGKSRKHGRRPGVVSGCCCSAKSACFSTWNAAMAAVVRVPDAIRTYRGTCCGHYHITSLTEDEFAQRCAEYNEPERERPDVRAISQIHGVYTST